MRRNDALKITRNTRLHHICGDLAVVITPLQQLNSSCRPISLPTSTEINGYKTRNDRENMLPFDCIGKAVKDNLQCQCLKEKKKK
ncbi:hypothetical protein OUZ56_021142 [Daphnia magna]|uniref:Uncharacterized protein n=1 Tax=Daphnia magna TaxID=35525 RepID=A0ABQ9ZHK3_9CRUS|nr:hypothetical protein OUZ56_021142 [Daphnia magna]